jgi:hypothetical protein
MGKNTDHIKLDEAGRRYPFHTPEGYFDRLPMAMMDRIETATPERKDSVLIRYLKPALGLVAGFILIFGLVYVPMRILSPSGTSHNQTALADDVYYLLYAMNDHHIFEAIDTDSPEASFDNEQLENYLFDSVNEYELTVLNN